MIDDTPSAADGSARRAEFARRTRETDIRGMLDLDPVDRATNREIRIDTGVGMLDHMLEALATHAGWSLTIEARGDLQVDDHHVVEDCGIVLARLLDAAVGDRTGIHRFGWAMVPLDEALTRVSVDLVARPSASVELGLATPMLGGLSAQNATHFLETLALTMPFTLHVRVLEGRNDHHRLESAFKSLALALRQAVAPVAGVASTKGTLR